MGAQLAEAYRKVESGLELLGVTGIEDRLQEGVKETIEKLRAAGIKVWVLTGDKEETAINVAYSSGLFDQRTRKLLLTRQPDMHSSIRTMHRLLEQCVLRIPVPLLCISFCYCIPVQCPPSCIFSCLS